MRPNEPTTRLSIGKEKMSERLALTRCHHARFVAHFDVKNPREWLHWNYSIHAIRYVKASSNIHNVDTFFYNIITMMVWRIPSELSEISVFYLKIDWFIFLEHCKNTYPFQGPLLTCYLIQEFPSKGHQGKIESCCLATNGQNRKLNSNTPRQAARPHFETSTGVRTVHCSRNGIIPNIHNTIPTNENSIKQSNIFYQRTKHQPFFRKKTNVVLLEFQSRLFHSGPRLYPKTYQSKAQ